MTDSPDQPTGPDDQLAAASTEPPAQDPGQEPPDEEPNRATCCQPDQEQCENRSRRSNEFWLALAGIAASVVVGLTSNWLAYNNSAHQLKAESDRAALSFSRDQRKAAYAEYLNSVSDLSSAEYKMKYPSPGDVSAPVELKQLENLFAAYNEMVDKFNRANSTVRLLESPSLEQTRVAIRDRHSEIFFQIDRLMAAARADARPDSLVALRIGVNLDSSPDLEQRFIDVAKQDLGLAD